MKIDGTEKVIARIDTPEFKKHPLFGISIGGHYNKWFGYVRGDNFGVMGIFGIYISFRLPYQPSVVYGQGVDAGFNAAAKTVSYLLTKINQQAAIIKQLTTMLEEVQEHLDNEGDDDEEENDDFKPNWN